MELVTENNLLEEVKIIIDKGKGNDGNKEILIETEPVINKMYCFVLEPLNMVQKMKDASMAISLLAYNNGKNEHFLVDILKDKWFEDGKEIVFVEIPSCSEMMELLSILDVLDYDYSIADNHDLNDITTAICTLIGNDVYEGKGIMNYAEYRYDKLNPPSTTEDGLTIHYGVLVNISEEQLREGYKNYIEQEPRRGLWYIINNNKKLY